MSRPSMHTSLNNTLCACANFFILCIYIGWSLLYIMIHCVCLAGLWTNDIQGKCTHPHIITLYSFIHKIVPSQNEKQNKTNLSVAWKGGMEISNFLSLLTCTWCAWTEGGRASIFCLWRRGALWGGRKYGGKVLSYRQHTVVLEDAQRPTRPS